MGFLTDIVVVDDSAPQIVFSGGHSALGGFPRAKVLIRNTGTKTVFLGGPTVDTDGFPLQATELISFSPLAQADVLYGICTAAETTTLKLIWVD